MKSPQCSTRRGLVRGCVSIEKASALMLRYRTFKCIEDLFFLGGGASIRIRLQHEQLLLQLLCCFPELTSAFLEHQIKVRLPIPPVPLSDTRLPHYQTESTANP